MKRLSFLLTLCFALQTFALSSGELQNLHNLVIKFYGYQRAGLASGSCHNLNNGFTDAAHSGDKYDNQPLDGGWYDAGDYIKFGMPLGYTVYSLLKGYDVFPDAYDDNYDWKHDEGPDGIPDILNQVKFATDYLIKAVIDEQRIVFDVGVANTEHRSMSAGGPDRGNNEISLCDGADIPATYAACLALMSTIYRNFSPTYADSCLEKAKIAFNRAKTLIDENKLFCTPQEKQNDYDGQWEPLYDYGNEIQIEDRMVAAGVELYRATNNEDPTYIEWAKKPIGTVYNCMGYGFIGPLASFEVWRQGLGSASSLTSNVNTFILTRIHESGHFDGIFQNNGWGTARDAGAAAFEFGLMYVLTPSESDREKLLQLANRHIEWIAGSNPRNESYVVGYNNGPSSIHYRSPDTPEGGLVSGPNSAGQWSDDGSAEFCEVAIDYNAGIIGALAFLRAVKDPSPDVIGVQESFSVSPNADVDFTVDDVTFTARFSQEVPWSIKINGTHGTDSLSGSGSTISATWDGVAERGYFLGGEFINATLEVNGNIAAYDLLKVRPVSIDIDKVAKAPGRDDDRLIDDFEDGDENNTLGGKWEANGTGSGFSATTIDIATEDGSEVLKINANCGSEGPQTYTGARATLNSDGSPTSIGSANSIVFDMKASKSAKVYVELEQSDISDGAYYAIEIPAMTVFNNYRVNISDFKQPNWKTSEVPFDPSKITALRFTIYDNVGMMRLWVDNVYIENLSTAVNCPTPRTMRSKLKPIFSKGSLSYTIPEIFTGKVNLSVYNVAGKIVLQRTLNANSNQQAKVSLSELPHGIYAILHSANGQVIGDKMMITHVK